MNAKTLTLFLFFAAIFWSIPLCAQSVWFKDNAHWRYYTPPAFSPEEFRTDIYIDGDTIIDLQPCKIINRITEQKNLDTGVKTYTEGFYGYVYEENGKIYGRHNTENFELMYDFSLEVGDFFTYSSYACNTDSIQLELLEVGIEMIDNTAVNYQVFKMPERGDNFPETTVKFFERIGLTETQFSTVGYNGLFPGDVFSCFFVDPPSSFTCYSDDDINFSGDCEFLGDFIDNTQDLNRGRAIKVYPNPAQDVLRIENTSSQTISHIKILNTLGQLVKTLPINETNLDLDISDLASGLFFVNFYAGDHLIGSKKVMKSKI